MHYIFLLPFLLLPLRLQFLKFLANCIWPLINLTQHILFSSHRYLLHCVHFQAFLEGRLAEIPFRPIYYITPSICQLTYNYQPLLQTQQSHKTSKGHWTRLNHKIEKSLNQRYDIWLQGKPKAKQTSLSEIFLIIIFAI